MSNVTDSLRTAIAHLQAGRPGQARLICQQILSEQADHPDALNLMGIVEQNSGNLAEAATFFGRAIASNPQAPGYHINQGNLQRALGDFPGAEQSYRRALELRPDSPDGHNNLGAALQLQGRMEEAEASYRKAAQIRPDYAEAMYNLGVLFQEQDRLDDAAESYLQATRVNPGYAQAWNNLGTVRQLQGALEEAEKCYRHALQLQPAYPDGWYNLGNLFQEQGALAQAVEAYQRSIQLQPDFADAHRNLGSTFCRMGRLEEAERHDRKAIELQPDEPAAWNNLGITLKDTGQTAEAESAYRKALELNSGYIHARGNLASLLEVANRLDDAKSEVDAGLALEPDDALLNLIGAKLERRDGKTDEALARLEGIPVDQLPEDRAGQLHAELGILHDRAGDPAQAFEHLQIANEVLARETSAMGIDKQRYLDKLARMEQRFSPDWVATWVDHAAVASTDKAPVFLVGFPRSGTTLLEVTLDSHPALTTLEEQPTIVQVSQRLRDSAGDMPDSLATLSAEQLTDLRNYYCQLVDQYAPDRGDVTVIDKMPLSIVDVPLLWRLFPDAKFILALRHPADAVLSCFMQSFQPNVAMANMTDIEDIASLYDRCMTLWQRYAEALPLNYHTIRYEDVVGDFEGQTRALVKFLELPWDDAVLEYQANAAKRTRINTPSYHQVTEPIYTRARFRWERYKDQLAPVMETLDKWAQIWGY